MCSTFKKMELTKLDCYKVMQKKLQPGDQFNLLNYRTVCFDEINGYLGDHCSLEIEIEQRNGEREIFKFFVKSLPQLESQRTFLLEFDGFFKEKQFFTKYQHLLKTQGITTLNNAVPICYFANEELFVFEDLAAKGYVTLPSRESLDVECIKVGLITVAKLHSSSLILEELQGCKLTENYERELQESFFLPTESSQRAMGAVKSGIRALIDLTHTEDMHISKESFMEKAQEGVDLLKVFTKPSNKFRNTICHADLWTKNLMFKFEEGKAVNCVLVDFQTYRYAPPAHDVLAFIYLVSDRETRKQHMDELLKFYYDNLRMNLEQFQLKNVMTEEEFYQSCDHFKRYALTQNLCHFQVVILSDEIASELFSDAERARSVLFEDKYDFFTDTCNKDPVFRQKNFELIEELREFYEKLLIM